MDPLRINVIIKTGSEFSLKIKRRCDGCGAYAPTLKLPADWLKRDGWDYCPDCQKGIKQ